MLGLALAAAVLQDAPSQDDLARKVADEVRRLGADSLDEREAAQKALTDLPPAADRFIDEALKGAQDPEVRTRLSMVVRDLVPKREESYAIAQINKADAFPDPGREIITWKDARRKTVEGSLRIISEFSKIPIEFYPGDETLKPLAETTKPRMWSHTNAENALAEVLHREMDATYVVDGSRIVIVRLTMPVFLARFAADSKAEASSLGLATGSRIRSFGSPSVPRSWADGNIARLILNGSKSNDAMNPQSEKWLTRLQDVALNDAAAEDDRILALRALAELRWDPNFWARSAEIPKTWQTLAEGSKTPRGVAEAARFELTRRSLDEDDTAVKALESGSVDLQKRLLAELYSRRTYSLPMTPVAKPTEEVRKKLLGRLDDLRKSPNPDVAVLSAAAAVALGNADAVETLAKAAIPSERGSVLAMIEQLTPHRPDVARDRFAKHAHPDYRAAYVMCLAQTKGDDRTAAADRALAMLDDDAPIVRCFAVWTLSTLGDAIQNGDSIKARLLERQRAETHEVVLEALENALKAVDH